MTATPTGAPRVPASGGPTTTVRNAGGIGPARSGCTRRCRSGQSPLSDRAILVKPGFLKITLTADAACRWYRPFAFGEQGGDWFRITGRVERYLDDWRNWPTSTDCPAKIRETAANPRPQDRDTHFGSRN
jgi:hypothetical protein